MCLCHEGSNESEYSQYHTLPLITALLFDITVLPGVIRANVH